MGYAIAALAIAGTAASLYAANKAKQGSGQSMATPGQVLQDSGSYAKAQEKIDANQAQLALQYYPQFAQEQEAATANMMQLALKDYPQFAQAEQAATSQGRAQDLADFQQNSGGWMQQLSAISPAYAQLGIQSQANQANTPLLQDLNMQAINAGPSDLRTALQNSAMYQLSLGGSTTPEEQRDATQAADAGWSARGLINSNPAVAAEVLNRDALSNQRLQQREGFAQNAQQLGLAEDTANRQFGVSVQGANEASTGNFRNFLVSASQAETQPILQAGMQRTDVSPYGMFGASAGVASPYGISSIFQTAPQLSSYTGGITQLYADQLALQEGRANNSASDYAALGGGLTSMAGSMYGKGGGSSGGFF